jgi:hypothetical protein
MTDDRQTIAELRRDVLAAMGMIGAVVLVCVEEQTFGPYSPKYPIGGNVIVGCTWPGRRSVPDSIVRYNCHRRRTADGIELPPSRIDSGMKCDRQL